MADNLQESVGKAVAIPFDQQVSRPSWLKSGIQWIRRNPLSAALLFTISVTFIYFFGFLHLFSVDTESTLVWAWRAWNPETNYEHAKLIPLIVVFLVWYDRQKLMNAPLGSSR